MKEIIVSCGGIKKEIPSPAVMGILNITPDSFYPGSRISGSDDLIERAGKMITDGASILDIGAVSTRPGAAFVSEDDEISRLIPAVKAVSARFPDVIISVDTFRQSVAQMAIEAGALMVNDIYAGRFDENMIPWIIEKNITYIIMHMKGTPEDMQRNPEYGDVLSEVNDFFRERISHFPSSFRNIIIDPGFGFGKTIEHNFTLLGNLDSFMVFGFPVLAGLSRKATIQKILDVRSPEALNGTTVLNTVALLKGASILRVHDVKEAAEAVKLLGYL